MIARYIPRSRPQPRKASIIDITDALCDYNLWVPR